jgi:hypothetical protein
MVSSDFAQIMSLHAGEAYAMQNLTRTDRLGLLLSGKVSVAAHCGPVTATRNLVIKDTLDFIATNNC